MLSTNEKFSQKRQRIIGSGQNSGNSKNLSQQQKYFATGENSRNRQKFYQYKRTLATGEKSKNNSNTHISLVFIVKYIYNLVAHLIDEFEIIF